MRLHTRIYIHFLALLLVVGLLASAISLTGARGAFMRDLVGRVARHSATLLGESVANQTALQQRMDQLYRDFEVDITLRDLEGKVMTQVGTLLPAPDAARMSELSQGRVVLFRQKRRIATAMVTDSASGRPRGIMSLAVKRRFDWGLFYRPLIFVLAALALVAIGTRPLARRIAQPLERLAAAARRFGDGDLSYRMPVPAGHAFVPSHKADELIHLTRAFNDMADRVGHRVRAEKELLANVSYEFRTPLVRMRTALALLPETPENAAGIKALKGDLAELDTALNDVLTSARLEANGPPSHIERVDLRELMHGLAQQATEKDPVKGRCQLTIDENVPSSIEADPMLLKRALWNLIDNAMKFGAPPLNLGAAMQGKKLHIQIDDRGPGIPPDQRTRVLDPFVRLHDERQNPEHPAGHGVGLTLARRIAESHGGALSIEAGPDNIGCRALLTIPLDPLPAGAAMP